MKEKMMSKRSMDYLFDHILDGFKSSHQGILNLQQQGIVSNEDIAELVKKNSERLIERIQEFKLHEKIFGLFFASLFLYNQITCEDMDMRRSRRMRVRRKTESENVITL